MRSKAEMSFDEYNDLFSQANIIRQHEKVRDLFAAASPTLTPPYKGLIAHLEKIKFTMRNPKIWCSLLDAVITSNSLEDFKTLLKVMIDEKIRYHMLDDTLRTHSPDALRDYLAAEYRERLDSARASAKPYEIIKSWGECPESKMLHKRAIFLKDQLISTEVNSLIDSLLSKRGDFSEQNHQVIFEKLNEIKTILLEMNRNNNQVSFSRDFEKMRIPSLCKQLEMFIENYESLYARKSFDWATQQPGLNPPLNEILLKYFMRNCQKQDEKAIIYIRALLTRPNSEESLNFIKLTLKADQVGSLKEYLREFVDMQKATRWLACETIIIRESGLDDPEEEAEYAAPSI